jgi:hypothetical protein
MKNASLNPYDLPPELLASASQKSKACSEPFKLESNPPPRRKKTQQERSDEAAARSRRQYERQQARNERNAPKPKPNPYRRPIATPDETEFRHKAWEEKRKAVYAALEASHVAINSLQAFSECGAECTIEYNREEGKYRLKASYCKSRWCEPCMRAKGNLMAQNLRDHVLGIGEEHIRFVTLTIRHTNLPLTQQIDNLLRWYKQLRATPIWKNSQHGGASTVEIKWNEKTQEWHPHLHILCEGVWMHQGELSDTWRDITGGSWEVKIEKLKKGKDMAWYLCKYVSKAVNDDVWQNPERAKEFVEALKGRRMCATFGCWRGVKLQAKPPQTGKWTRVATLNEVAAAFRRGETWAIKLLDKMWNEMRYDPSRQRGSRQESQRQQIQPVVPN